MHFLLLKSTFSKNSFSNAIKFSNSLDPDQAQCFVRPNLSPDCLQWLSAQRVNHVGPNKKHIPKKGGDTVCSKVHHYKTIQFLYKRVYSGKYIITGNGMEPLWCSG